MTEVVPPINGRRLDSRFTLLEKLGSGGQGEVWRAHDDTRGLDIALKVPANAAANNHEVLALFEREHAIASRLDHASVLKVFPPHHSGDTVVLPMELATGGDLRRMRGAGYLDIIPVLLDIAQALEHAHDHGIIHRDLKPGNVLFDARGRVKLADFGAAGTTSTTAADARRQGLSPFTASPEQLRGEAPTEADDIYGLGALAYELLSGYPPYYPHFDLRRAQEDPVPDLVPTRQVPPGLSQLVMRMLAKNKHERPRSMREVIDELDAALNDTLAFDFEAIGDPAPGAPTAAESASPPLAPPAAQPVRPQPAQKRAATDVDEVDDLHEENDESDDESEPQLAEQSADPTDEEPPDLTLIPELLVANALVVTRSGKTLKTPAIEKSPLATDETQALPPLTRQMLAARGAAAHSNAVTANLTQALLENPVASHVAVALGRAPKVESTAVDETQALPPLTLDALPAHGAAARLDPTLSNLTQALPEDPATSHAASALTSVAKADQAWSNKTQVLPEEVGAAHVEVGRSQASKSDPTWANRTQVLPEDPATARATTAAHAKLAAGWAAQADRARANAFQTHYLDQGMPPNQPSQSDMTWRHSASSTPPQPRTDSATESSQRRSNAPPEQGPARRDRRDVAVSPSEVRQHLSSPQNAASQAPPLHREQPPQASTAAPPSIAQTPVGQRETSTPPAEHAPMHASLAAVGVGGGVGAVGPSMTARERPLWESLQLDTVPRVARLQPMRRRRWPVVLLGTLTGIAIAVFYWLPRYAPQSLPIDLASIAQVAKNLAAAGPEAQSDAASSAATTSQARSPADAATTPAADNSADAKLQATRENFDRRLAGLEARGAGVWGGRDFAIAKMRAAESIGARDAGNIRMAQDRLTDASHLLDEVESRASQALADQVAAGETALAAGQEEVANQAFELARRIDPSDRRIAEGQRHTRNLSGVLPLLADAQNAEGARNYSRAAQDYSQVLALDPGNENARSGLARANAAFGYDNYAKSVGSGFAALGAGRLDDARAAFEKARALKPNGSEAAEGLRRVGAALSARGYASLRQRAAGLESQERWDEAVEAYNLALKQDPSLAFAQEGRRRAAARAELGASMQAIVDQPERLTSAAAREQARALLQSANLQTTSGPVLRSQIARLELLLPDYEKAARADSPVRNASLGSAAWRSDAVPVPVRADSYSRADMQKPVKLSMMSDNATAVAIPSIGQFGTFAKRDIELKPGRYTVVGTRDGYREVRRDITITPGENQTISVSCSDPI